MYVPALTAALVTAAEPVAPEIGVGPAAVRVHAVGTAVPPLSLVTVLTSVRCGPMSSLLIVQVTLLPGVMTTALPPVTVAPVQVQELGV